MEISKQKDVPFDVIKRSVSYVSKVCMNDIDASRMAPLSRQQNKVAARQISMTLCKTYTRASLSVIGKNHGGYDHATVLHATKTINNLIDTNDPMVTPWFYESDEMIQRWRKDNCPIARAALVKHWIRNHVPLFVRYEYLQSIGNKCLVCGGKVIIINYHGHKIKTVPSSL